MEHFSMVTKVDYRSAKESTACYRSAKEPADWVPCRIDWNLGLWTG
jgi:hypothetical protein